MRQGMLLLHGLLMHPSDFNTRHQVAYLMGVSSVTACCCRNNRLDQGADLDTLLE